MFDGPQRPERAGSLGAHDRVGVRKHGQELDPG